MAWRTLKPDEVDEATASGVVMLDFFQDACAPCHVLEPRLETFARKHRGELTVYQIDIDDNADTPQRLAVMRRCSCSATASRWRASTADPREDLEQALAQAS